MIHVHNQGLLHTLYVVNCMKWEREKKKLHGSSRLVGIANKEEVLGVTEILSVYKKEEGEGYCRKQVYVALHARYHGNCYHRNGASK